MLHAEGSCGDTVLEGAMKVQAKATAMLAWCLCWRRCNGRDRRQGYQIL